VVHQVESAFLHHAAHAGSAYAPAFAGKSHHHGMSAQTSDPGKAKFQTPAPKKCAERFLNERRESFSVVVLGGPQEFGRVISNHLVESGPLKSYRTRTGETRQLQLMNLLGLFAKVFENEE
jgi:hypothetical protein